MSLTNKQPLAKLRNDLGLTLKQVAERINADDAAVSRWERFESEPHPEYRCAYAKTLGISLQELGRIIYTGRLSASRPSAPKRTRRGQR